MAQQAQLSFGEMVRTLRAEKGMTQLDLARKMGVTDKAVSKWERDLSIPDVASLPKLAEELGTSVDELLQAKTAAQEAAAEDGAARKKAAALVEQLAVALRARAYQKNVGVAHGLGVDAVGREVVDAGIRFEHTFQVGNLVVGYDVGNGCHDIRFFSKQK